MIADRRIRSILEASGLTVWTADVEGRDTGHTVSMTATGQHVAAAHDGSWMRNVHPADRHRVLDAWTAALESHATFEVQYRIAVRGEDYRWHRARAVPVRDEREHVTGWIGVFSEIDQHVRRDEGMRFLAEASASLPESLDEGLTLDTLARLVVDNIADGCMITLAKPDGTFEHVSTRSADDNATARFAAETERLYPLPSTAASGYPRAIRTGEPELILEGAFDDEVLPAVAADATHLARLQQMRMYSGMVVPLVARGTPVGAITLVLHGDRTRRGFDTGDLALATELARRASLALDNARLFAAERSARAAAANAADRVQALADASRIFSEAATEPQQLMDALCRIATQRIGDMCVVQLLADDGRTLQTTAAHHVAPELTEEFRAASFDESLPEEHGLSARIMRDGTALFMPHTNPEELTARAAGLHRRFLERHPFRSVIGVPMRAEGRILGTVLLARESPAHSYAHEDVALMQDLADRASLVLERARLFSAERDARAEAERAAELTRRLQEITASFARTITLQEVAAVTLSHGLDVLGATAGMVYRAEGAGGTLVLMSVRGLHHNVAPVFHRVPTDAHLLIAEAVRARTIIYIDTLTELVARYPVAGQDISRMAERWMAIPLFHDDRVLGALALGFTSDNAGFSPAQRALADALGRHCAQAMERARLLEDARRSRDEAEHANQAKSDLLAKVSHETRQPVHATVGWVEMLDLEIYGPITTPQRDALRRIKDNQSRLLTVLNDLLDMSRIEAGKLELRMRDIVVVGVVDVVESAIAPQMRDRDIDYVFVRPPLDVRVHADIDQLVGILTNLLGNAAKFTPRGGTVRVRCEAEASTVRVVVTDTGIGIPSDLLDRVFEPFFQVERGFTRTTIGTGLGLAISREAARAMGGDITVTSVMGEGSVFTVELLRA